MATATSTIHPTAVIAEGATIGENVTIGPYCVVGPNVSLGDGCQLASHVVIEGHTTVGPDNRFFPFCAVGQLNQDLKHKGEPTELIIGRGNTFRECVTLHIGTVVGGGKTVIGDGGLFMAYTHVAHDCYVGNRVIFANLVQLAGHCHVGDGCVLEGNAMCNQFITIGRGAYISGNRRIVKDVPPFMKVDEEPARVVAPNTIGLARQGFGEGDVDAVKRVFRKLYLSRRKTGQSLPAAIDELRAGGLQGIAADIVDFIDARKDLSPQRLLEHHRNDKNFDPGAFYRSNNERSNS